MNSYFPTKTPPRYIGAPRPNNDTPCKCGRRYGMHRVNDYACPNQKWVPGNGQKQWLDDKFRRATA